MVINKIILLALVLFLLPFVTSLDVTVGGKKDGFKSFKIKSLLYIIICVLCFIGGYYSNE